MGHRSGWAVYGHGRVNPVQLPYAERVASGQKNAPLSHHGTKYRGYAELDRKDIKTKHGYGGNEARERKGEREGRKSSGVRKRALNS